MICPPHRYRVEKPDGGPYLAGACKCGERRTWPAALQEQSAYALKRRLGTEKIRRKA